MIPGCTVRVLIRGRCVRVVDPNWCSVGTRVDVVLWRLESFDGVFHVCATVVRGFLFGAYV